MRAIWPLLASVLSLCNGADGMMASSAGGAGSSGAPTPAWHTLLKPCMSMYDFYYNSYQGSEHCKGRSLLNASLVDSFSTPFSNANWSFIGVPYINIDKPTDPSDDPMENVYSDDERLFAHCVDNTAMASVPVRAVYTATLCLFINLAYKWLHGTRRDDLTAIRRYLGLDAAGARLVDVSMTQLANQQRKRVITVNRLLLFFYFACDIERKDEGVPIYDYLGDVEMMFTSYVGSYAGEPFYAQATRMDGTDALIDKLKFCLQMMEASGENTDAPFAVSIRSMKMKVLAEPTANELVNAIQQRSDSAYETLTVRDYVSSYANEIDPVKINKYHLCILGVLITHAFGYVFNFFEVLYYLLRFEIDNDDKVLIGEFSAFVDGYLSIFVDRYFEFYGNISQKLVDAMFRIMFFLSPGDQPKVYARGISEDERLLLNTFDHVDFSILDYYCVCNKSADKQKEFVTKYFELINSAFGLIKSTFVGYVAGSDKKWYQWTRLPGTLKKLNKASLVDLLSKNSARAFETLRIFSSEFEVPRNYY